MSIVRGTVLQSGADAFTQFAIDTNISIDGKFGWEITGFKAYCSTLYTDVTTADYEISALLAVRATTVTTMNESEEIARVMWANNFSTAAVAYPVEPVKLAQMLETRATVQPQIYVGLSSTGTGATNRIYYEISYDIVKLSELEVMRLLVGGV
jgi:hypothetical protein